MSLIETSDIYVVLGAADQSNESSSCAATQILILRRGKPACYSSSSLRRQCFWTRARRLFVPPAL
eukprot:6580388-Prorocentrum_lima.AAC.1